MPSFGEHILKYYEVSCNILKYFEGRQSVVKYIYTVNSCALRRHAQGYRDTRYNSRSQIWLKGAQIMKKKILEYNVVFQKEEDGGYSVWVPDLGGCASQGDNLEEAISNIKEAMELYLEDADEDQLAEGREHKEIFLVPVQVPTP